MTDSVGDPMQMYKSCTLLFIIKKYYFNISKSFSSLTSLGVLILLMVDVWPTKQMLKVDPLG